MDGWSTYNNKWVDEGGAHLFNFLQDSHELYHILLSTLQEEQVHDTVSCDLCILLIIMQEHHSVDSLSSISDIIKVCKAVFSWNMCISGTKS